MCQTFKFIHREPLIQSMVRTSVFQNMVCILLSHHIVPGPHSRPADHKCSGVEPGNLHIQEANQVLLMHKVEYHCAHEGWISSSTLAVHHHPLPSFSKIEMPVPHPHLHWLRILIAKTLQMLLTELEKKTSTLGRYTFHWLIIKPPFITHLLSKGHVNTSFHSLKNPRWGWYYY